MTRELSNFLDGIDISEFLEHDRSFEDIMDEVDAIYGDEYMNKNDEWMFADCSQEDFADYVYKVYGVKHYERSILFVR